MTAKKQKAKKREPAQSRRFKEAAHEFGADESGQIFERAFKKIVPTRTFKGDQGQRKP